MRQTPPGPTLPSLVQTGLFLRWPFWFVRHCQRRFGDIFTLNLLTPGPVVYVADPQAIRALFARDGKDAHAGASNELLEPVTGAHSLLLLDRDEHLQERRLLNPSLHGEALAGLKTVAREASERELANWPTEGVLTSRPAMQRITFEVICSAVMGAEDPALRARLLLALEPVFALPLAALVPLLQRDLGPWSPWGRFKKNRATLDRELFALIEDRRRQPPKEDLLGVLLESTREDGAPLSDSHIRDELVTLLIAGHETTATALSWSLERLAHHPKAVHRLRAELKRGSTDLLESAGQEILRLRPVVMDVARQLSDDLELGGFPLAAGTTVMPGIYLVQLDGRYHSNPEEFQVERFLGEAPSPQTWLPFGGGRRRCLGASLAMLELRVVLEAILRQFVLQPATSVAEKPRLRGITFAPEHDGRVHVRRSPLSEASEEDSGAASECRRQATKPLG